MSTLNRPLSSLLTAQINHAPAQALTTSVTAGPGAPSNSVVQSTPLPPPMIGTESEAPTAQPKSSAVVKKANSSGGPSNAASPKPARAKEQPPPLPQGSGLLSSAFFGVDDVSSSSGASNKAPNIILHVPLKGQTNQVVNFARLAEERYGFAALYPRLAAQKERLAKVAAASAALEKKENGGKSAGISAGESGDEEMSLDIDRDSDNDGDVAMTGTNGGLGTAGNSGNEGAPKKKRKRKIEEYDREDPFVDDTELAWEAQAAASKDGFFVYSGPLVPEGEKLAVERYVHVNRALFYQSPETSLSQLLY